MTLNKTTCKYVQYVFIVIAIFFAKPSFSQVNFTPNVGQWEGDFTHKISLSYGNIYVTKTGVVYDLWDGAALKKVLHDQFGSSSIIQFHSVKIAFAGNASQPESVEEFEPEKYYSNYFLGSNSKKWKSKVKSYKRIILRKVWPNIDVEMITNSYGIKYNYIVHPGGNVDDIKLKIIGAEDYQLTDTGNFVINTKLGDIIEEKPIAEQYNFENQVKTVIEAKFQIKSGILSYKINRYNKDIDLIIDPQVIFATFSGSAADNFGFTGTFDKEGNSYSGGTVYSKGFPTTFGAYQSNYNGGIDDQGLNEVARDAGIIKYNPTGSVKIWCTYLGGSGNDQPHSMIVDANGDLVIFGTTNSLNFPIASNAYSKSNKGNYDIYISKLTNDGRVLKGSTYIGGGGRDGLNAEKPSVYPSGRLAYNYGDQYRGEVIVDKSNNIWVTTSTQSGNFPIASPYQSGYGSGGQDGCVIKLSNDLSNLLVSSYIGGSGLDAAYGINIDSKGSIYICGGTESVDLPKIPVGAYQRSYNNEIDGYIYKLDPNGNNILSGTYLGTEKYDQTFLIQIDLQDKVYVTGQSAGNFPVSQGVYFNTAGHQFITILSNDLKSLIRSTVIGSGRTQIDISPSAFLVDHCYRICLSGWGGGANNQYNPITGNTIGLRTTTDAYQTTTDGSDFYLIILSRDLNSIVYGSFFGGNISQEHVDGGTSRFDSDGKVYQSVCGGCGGFSDFPTTDGAWSRVNRGKRPNDPNEGGCNNAFFKIDLNSSNYAPEFKDSVITVTAGDTIDFNFDIVDRDLSDSIYVYATGSPLDAKITKLPIATFKSDSAIGKTTARFNWITNCNHISKDSYTVTIIARDNGCPSPRRTIKYLKILVKEPKAPPAPKIFCIQRQSKNVLILAWDEFKITKSIKSYKIVKVFPDGREIILHTITSDLDKKYIDGDAADHLTNNFCYFIYGVSICDKNGDSTRKICSIPDKDSIPEKVYMWTATVENNKYVKVIWNKYKKEDFYRYWIYKRTNTANSDWVLLKEYKDISDTTINDSNVNVAAYSYCYKVVVNTQCGLFSPEGNYACTILLKGNSVPFSSKLNWNKYEIWDGKIRNYQIHRTDPLTAEKIIDSTQQIIFSDDNLNYDVGLYYYQVKAWENQPGRGAYSLSNKIKLYQEPILHIPNAFSPNGNGTNDKWQTVPVFVKDYNMTIYNRWGQRVWTTGNKKEQWDAIFNNNESFLNVFVYIVTYTGWEGSEHYKSGNVTIVK